MGGWGHIKELLGSNTSTRVQSRVAEVIFPHRWVSSCCFAVFFFHFEGFIWGAASPTWMQVPVCSRHRLQARAQRLAGMCDTLVMGSIFSGQPMLTWMGDRRILNKQRIHSDYREAGFMGFVLRGAEQTSVESFHGSADVPLPLRTSVP